MRIGMNIEYGNPGRTDTRFNDLAVSVGPWIKGNVASTAIPQTTEPLPVGYTRNLGGGSYLKPGAYTLTCGGTGTIILQHPDLVDTNGHKGSLTCSFPAPNGSYSATLTNPGWVFPYVQASSATDPLHDLHFMAPGASHGGLWHPDYLDSLRPFGVLRSMDWLQVLGNPLPGGKQVTVWADRQVQTGYELEGLFDLCNVLGADPWVNLPHPCATLTGPTDYPAKLGALIAATLPATRTVYLEYSDECWNYGNPWGIETTYTYNIGTQVVNPKRPTLAGGIGRGYGFLSTQAFDAIEAAARAAGWGGRFVRVFASQASYISNLGPGNISWPGGPAWHMLDEADDFGWRIDALSCAPYADWPESGLYTMKILGELAAVDMEAALELYYEGMRSYFPVVQSWCQAWRNAADHLGVPLYYYEMSPGSPRLWQNPATLPVIQATASDPRTADLWRDYLVAIGAYASLGCFYSHCTPSVWGAMLNQGDTANMRYKGLTDYVARWEGTRPVPTQPASA